MVQRGDATPEDVDTAMELGAGYRESCPEADDRRRESADGQLWA